MKNNIESILAIDEIYKMECLENFSFGMNNLWTSRWRKYA